MSWEKNKYYGSTEEALGKRKCKSHKNRSNTPWFTEEIKTLADTLIYNIEEKQSQYNEYKEVRNRVNEAIRKIKRNCWEKF